MQPSTSPSKAEKKKIIADLANQLAQHKAQAEKNKNICTKNYKRKRLNGEAHEDGTKEKPATGKPPAP